MKNKEGFTLIELLAVIIILAIIALITTPVIMGVISKANKSANIRSSENYLRALDLALAGRKITNSSYIKDGIYYVQNDGSVCKGKKSCIDSIYVDIDGVFPQSGTIEYENDIVTEIIGLVINGSVLNYFDGNFTYDDNEASLSCDLVEQNYENVLIDGEKLSNYKVINDYDYKFKAKWNKPSSKYWVDSQFESTTKTWNVVDSKVEFGSSNYSKHAVIFEIEENGYYQVYAKGRWAKVAFNFDESRIDDYVDETESLFENFGLKSRIQYLEKGTKILLIVAGRSSFYMVKGIGEMTIESMVGSKYSCNVNSNEKVYFHVLDDNKDGNISLIGPISDGNTRWDATSAYNTNGPITALNYAKELSNNWTNVPNIKGVYADEHISSISMKSEPNDYGFASIDVESIGTKARLPKMEELINIGCSYAIGTCPNWLIEEMSGEVGTHEFFAMSSFGGNVNGNTNGVWIVQRENKEDGTYGGGVYGLGNDQFRKIKPVIEVPIKAIIK